MSRDEQIREMARIIAKANGNEHETRYYSIDAADLYRAGYRKSTDLAEEIFAEIENNADLLYDGYRDIVVITEKDFAELKKKYTEGERE